MNENNDIMTPEELVQACGGNNAEREKEEQDNLDKFKVWLNDLLQKRIKQGYTFHGKFDTVLILVEDIPSEFLVDKHEYMSMFKSNVMFNSNIEMYLRNRGWGIVGRHTSIELVVANYRKSTYPKLPHAK